ncbi:ras-related protein Rab-23 [Octopus vulgaris]|uniref:Ras-related protein Rab-23 n=2 Tax=Octopus TaxID=6643 RepID=A0AA36B763_OCTVU|nr:ras-related protein Rab-23 [Octopus sinensis]XP_036361711.1 ras-related protein Rab-23 [Octopus sinensis]XP_036361712.1 ras-related protein Rab-23 [Octopus sinensis]XP_036361713.1 ras-related protein Rab-23 [Octopus sinensis]CAI9728799.1 ras-related protein Rab-23 [Octopus vulgaris]
MYGEDFETSIKIVVVGNGGVGKSSMIQRYCKGIFTQEYKKTIGVDFLEKQIIVGTQNIHLMLWDTAGQEEFDAITKAYYRGAQICILVFSTVDRESFEAIEGWKQKVEEEVGSIITVIVQNKIDLIDEAVVQIQEAEALSQKLQLRFYRISVKDNLNVNEVFRYLAEKYITEMNFHLTGDVPFQKIIGSTLPKCWYSTKRNAFNRKDISLRSMEKRLRTSKKEKKHSVDLKCSIL